MHYHLDRNSVMVLFHRGLFDALSWVRAVPLYTYHQLPQPLEGWRAKKEGGLGLRIHHCPINIHENNASSVDASLIEICMKMESVSQNPSITSNLGLEFLNLSTIKTQTKH